MRVIVTLASLILLPIMVATCLLWRIVLSPGIIMFGDLGFPVSLSHYLSTVFTSWNHQSSSPNGPVSYIAVGLFAVPFWLGIPQDFAYRLSIFIPYMLVGIFANASWKILWGEESRKLTFLAGSVVFSLVYMLNPFAISLIALPGIELAYGAFALAIALAFKVMDSSTLHDSELVSAALAGSVLSLFLPLLLVFALIVLCYTTAKILLHRTIQVFRRVAIRSLILLAIFLLVNAYWIESILVQIVPSGTASVIASLGNNFAIDTLGSQRGFGHGFDPMSVVGLNVTYGAFSLGSPVFGLVATTLALSSGLLLGKLSRTQVKRIVFFESVLVVGIALAVRTPIDEPVSSLAQFVFAQGLFWSFIRNPDHFMPLVILPLALSAGILATCSIKWAGTKLAKRVCQTNHTSILRVLLVSLMIGLMVSSYLISSFGTASSVTAGLQPIEYPPGLATIAGDLPDNSSRILWLPLSLQHVQYSWAPGQQRPYASPLLFSPVPILWTSTTEASHFLDYLYLQEILGMKTRNLGKVVSPFADYVVYYPQFLPQSASDLLDEAGRLEQSLTLQKDLLTVATDDNATILRNSKFASPFIGYEDSAVVVGGLDVYTSLAELPDFNPTQVAFFYADQLSATALTQAITRSSLVFFRNGTSWEDLYMNFGSDHFLFPSSETLYERSPDLTWSRIGDMVDFLHSFGIDHGKFFVQSGDFPIGWSSVVTYSPNANLQIPVSVNEAGQYEIWCRVLMNPVGGKLNISTDDGTFFSTNTTASSSYYKWILLGTSNLSAGVDRITLTNVSGLNAVNVVSVISHEDRLLLQQRLLDLLANRSVFFITRSLFSEMGRIDQISNPAQVDGQWIWGSTALAQTIEPTQTMISGIEVQGGRVGDAGTLSVELRQISENGTIEPIVLAQSELKSQQFQNASWNTLTIPLNYDHIEPSKPYAIVFAQIGGSTDSHWVLGRSPFTSTYGAGAMYTSSDGEYTWQETSADLYFKTFYPGSTNDLMESSISSVSVREWSPVSGLGNSNVSIPWPADVKSSIGNEAVNSKGYEIKVSNSGESIVMIPELFDPGWKASVKAQDIPVDSMMTGFVIDQPKDATILITYGEDNLLPNIISAATVLASAFVVIFRLVRKRSQQAVVALILRRESR